MAIPAPAPTQGSPSESLQAPLPGARAALVLLLAINLFNYIDRQVLAAVIPPIEREFFPEAAGGDSEPGSSASEFVEAKLGSLQTAFMVSYMVIAPIFGWLADRVSRWLLIGVGVALWSLASGGSGWAPTFLALLATRCFVGVGEAAYGPAAPTIISDLYPVQIRGKVLAWFYAAIPVGSALGYALGGLVLKLTGMWRWAFYVVLPPGLLLAFLCFFMPEPRRGQADLGRPASPQRARLKDYLTLLRTPSYVLVTLGMTAMTFALGGMAFWLPRFIVRDRHSSDLGAVNLIFGIILVVAGLVATLAGGIAGDKLRARYPGSYFLVSGISMLVAFPMVLLVIYAPFEPFPWAWVFIFMACFCLFFNTGPTNTILANVSHPSLRASAFALNIFVIHALGDAISPTVMGLIAGLSNMDTAFIFVSVMVLLGGLLWLWGTRYLGRDTALAPTRLAG
jgi:MFS transporter, Spinster family, sphingosine-1-phosphate transporter